ncbi:MAG: FCD domain-containing protein [Blautia faecis]
MKPVYFAARTKLTLKESIRFSRSQREVIEDKDYESYASLNQTFHMELWLAAGNNKLENMLSELWNELSRGMKINEEEHVRKSLNDHEEIVECIRKGK